MKILGLLIALTFTTLSANAADNNTSCSPWTKQKGISCVFNGSDAIRWERDCTNSVNSCSVPRYVNSPCDDTAICVDRKINPNLLESVCTDWVRENGVTCFANGHPSKSWRRACQKAWVAYSACQDTPPENI